jgi:HlyD family secretion protein
VETRSIIRAGVVGLGLLLAACRPNSSTSLLSGTIETDSVHVASRYGGRVKALFAQEGDSLKSGQRIAELDAAELGARRDQLAAELAALEAGPRPQEIDTAKHEWEAETANLELARADAHRARELFSQQTISVTERDQAVTREQSLDKSAAAAKSRYDLLLAGTRAEDLARARAQLAEIDTQLGEMKVAAPSDCVLEVLSVKVGDVLGPNQALATLLLPQHRWVRVYVPETWLAHIQAGDPARVRVDAFPGRDFPGVIEQVNREAEFTPRNVQTVEERVKQVFGVKVRLDPSNQELRAGMSADVTFPNVAMP